MAEENTRTTFAQKVVGAKEIQKIDVSKHVGKKVKIAEVQEHRGEFGPFLRIITEPVETLNGKDGEIEIRGSRLFSLSEDEEGSIYWPKGGNFDVFMTKMKCSDYKQLVGKLVQIVPVPSKKDPTKEYLSFN